MSLALIPNISRLKKDTILHNFTVHYYIWSPGKCMANIAEHMVHDQKKLILPMDHFLTQPWDKKKDLKQIFSAVG